MISASFEGPLEKRARVRGAAGESVRAFLSKITGLNDEHAWKRRDFKLEGQTLSYWDGQKKKGILNIKDCKIRKVAPDEVNGKENGFELVLPHGDTRNEAVYLSAESLTARAKWISILTAAAVAEQWQLRPKTLLKKTGRDVANALVAGPRDERQLLVLRTLQDGTNRAHFMEKFHDVTAELETLETKIQQHGDDMQLKLSRRRLYDELDEIKRLRAAYIIQALYRRMKSLRRIKLIKAQKEAHCRIFKFIRAFLFRQMMRRRILKRCARHVIGSLIVRCLAKMRRLQALRAGPRVILVEDIKGEKVKFDEACASSDFFFYVSSFFDPTEQFRGNQETRVEHGYGLRATSVFKSEGIKFNISPHWTEQRAIVTGSHANCFIVVTLVTRASKSSQEVFHGQAIIKLSDHPEIFDGRGAKAVISKAVLIKYVAPLEDVHGTSMLNINEAIHRKVDGSLSFTIRIPPNAYTAAGQLWKESGRFLSSEFKKRFFVLLEEKIFYTHSQSLLGSVKHLILCKEVTALTTEKSQGHDCVRIHFFSYAQQKKGSWLVYFADEMSKAARNEWMRKLYRCCPGLVGPDKAIIPDRRRHRGGAIPMSNNPPSLKNAVSV